MSYRKNILVDNEVYHVFNRGVASLPIFTCPKEFERFLELIKYYLYDPKISFSNFYKIPSQNRIESLEQIQKPENKLVDIYSYCLMDNHFHILLMQLKNNGVSKFISNIQNSYAKYFNTKHRRKGHLFESYFKSVRIENDEQFLHVSRYIHLNPSTAYAVEPDELEKYKWSSYGFYLKQDREQNILNTGKIISMVGSATKYIKFIEDNADYQRKLDRIKHLILD